MIEWFVPESDVERRLLEDPQLQRGWAWGKPRHGHPEGAVGRHVQAMLAEIAPDDPLRRDLRLLTLLHDTFKVDAREGLPYSPDTDHAAAPARARPVLGRVWGTTARIVPGGLPGSARVHARRVRAR